MDPLEGGAWQILEEKSITSASSGNPHEAALVPLALVPTQQDLEGVCKVDPALVPTDAEMDEDLGYGKLLNTVQLYQKDGTILSVHTATPPWLCCTKLLPKGAASQRWSGSQC